MGHVFVFHENIKLKLSKLPFAIQFKPVSKILVRCSKYSNLQSLKLEHWQQNKWACWRHKQRGTAHFPADDF